MKFVIFAFLFIGVCVAFPQEGDIETVYPVDTVVPEYTRDPEVYYAKIEPEKSVFICGDGDGRWWQC